MKNSKKAEIAFVAILVIYLALSGIRNFNSDYSHLQNDVVRIHILANSDSEEDQNLKLSVRDEILQYTNGWLSGCSSAAQAREILSSKIDEINTIAQQKVTASGYDYQTKSGLVNMEFDDRTYGDITMPHGLYSAVRVTIGAAAGHNWWCVMYPPLCIPAAGGTLKIDDYDDYFTDGEMDILKNCGKYKVKFRCVEVFNDLVSLFR